MDNMPGPVPIKVFNSAHMRLLVGAVLLLLATACRPDQAPPALSQSQSEMEVHLTATPAAVRPRQAVTFSWSVSGAGDMPLSCSLNVDSRGAAEYVVDCRETLRQRHSYAAIGTYTATLRVTGRDSVATVQKPVTVSASASSTISFAAAGDFGGRDDRAGKVMLDLKTRDVAAFLLLGDISYSEITPELAWCNWVHGYLGPGYPLELLVGNHEDDGSEDGFIRNFTACMPDRLGADLGPGGYGVNYAFDLGPVTVIATAPDLTVDGVTYTYAAGTAERAWLTEQLHHANSDGDWTVVGMHKNCLTIGNKACEIGQETAQLLVDEGADLVLQGHDHDYQRSKALTFVEPDTVPADAIADDGGDGVYARDAGTVFVIVGTVGRSPTICSHTDPEFAYFAAHRCAEESPDTTGYLLVSASVKQLEASFVPVEGDYTDTFVIQ